MAGEQVAASGSFKLRESVLVAVSNATPALASAEQETTRPPAGAF